MTADLEELADWLLGCGVDTVAMESTGVYWIPLYEVLETGGWRCGWSMRGSEVRAGAQERCARTASGCSG